MFVVRLNGASGGPPALHKAKAVSFFFLFRASFALKALLGAPDAPADRHRILTTPSGCAAPGCHAAAAPRTLCSAHAAVARLPGRAARADRAGRARQRRQNGAPSTPMKRCAIYARFSTEMQRATSLDDQIRNCRRFAAQMGWPILDEHVYQTPPCRGSASSSARRISASWPPPSRRPRPSPPAWSTICRGSRAISSKPSPCFVA